MWVSVTLGGVGFQSFRGWLSGVEGFSGLGASELWGIEEGSPGLTIAAHCMGSQFRLIVIS